MKIIYTLIVSSLFSLTVLFTPFVSFAQFLPNPGCIDLGGGMVFCPDPGDGTVVDPLPSPTPSKVIGTRFCPAGEVTFCRKVNNSFLDKSKLIPLYSQIITLLEQLVKSYEIKNTQ